MKKTFIISLGPITEQELGTILQLATAIAPLHEVVTYIADKPMKAKGDGHIRRKTITPEIIKQMQELRAENYDVYQIAQFLGCSRTSVNRHAPLPPAQMKLT